MLLGIFVLICFAAFFIFRAWHIAMLFGAFVFILLRGLFHFPSMAYRHVVLGFVLICFADFHFPSMASRHICFYFASQSFVIHALHRRTAFGSCRLDLSGFRKSLVVHAHGRAPIAELQEIAKRIIFNAQNEMAVCHCRVTKVFEVNDIQYAKQKGVPPTHEQQKSLKPIIFTAQTNMAFRHR